MCIIIVVTAAACGPSRALLRVDKAISEENKDTLSRNRLLKAHKDSDGVLPADEDEFLKLHDGNYFNDTYVF